MTTDLLRTDVLRGVEFKINREAEVIEGFAVVTKGVTHDRRGEFDDSGLDAVVEMGNGVNLGIKSRFGHPNMSSTALGTFLGRVKNFRRDGDVVRADLHIDPTAHKTPDGDLAQYVLGLAESDPGAFGSSMVIQWEEELRKEKDAEGNTLPPFIRVQKLFSVDVVDDPAANNGFFGMSFMTDSVRPSVEMTAFLDKFLAQPEAIEKVVSFLDRYRAGKQERKEIMEDLSVEKIKATRPDLFESIRASGEEDGRGKERERTVGILKKATAFKDMGDLALEAVETGVTLEQATIKFQDRQLANLQKAAPSSPGPDVEPEGNLSHFERAKKHSQEHKCNMTEALRATAQRRQ